MLTRRGWAAVAAAASTWVVARLIGSPDLHMMAVGILVLPLLALAFVRLSRPRLEVHRHLSTNRASLGSRVTVSVVVANHGRATTSFLLLEDAVPSALGRPARQVVAGIPPRREQTVSYALVCRQRGRYRIGPLTLYLTDPFGLARARFDASGTTDLVVFPEVEELSAGGLVAQGAGAGEAAVRHLYRSAADFYTMREYVTGDDLRRIHWPSVARTGTLMIRQDESTRRSSAILYLDTRKVALGGHGSPGFERGVSVAATLGRALSRAGFMLHLATVDSGATPMNEETMLETLAGATPSATRSLAASLGRLRATTPSDTTVALVTGPPLPGEVALIARAGSALGRRIAVFVYPAPLSSLPADAAAEFERRASSARVSLQRAGWDVYVVNPDGRLASVWRRQRHTKVPQAVPSS